MATGRITSIRSEKGFGFIKDTPGPKGNNDIFFHRSSVVGVNFEDLREGQEVSFVAGPDPRDPSRFRANNVSPVVAGDAPADEFEDDQN